MLSLALEPGRALGPFELGSSLWQIINHLRLDRNQWPRVSVAWEDHSRNEAPILLSTTSPPLRLLFEATTQLLMLIDLEDPGSWATYHGTSLAADEGKATRRSLSRIFGPAEAPRTHPSVATEALVGYPGATFGISTESGRGRGDLVTRVIVNAGPLAPNPYQTALATKPSRPSGAVERLAVQLSDSAKPCVLVHFSPTAPRRPPMTLEIGSTLAEDLRLDLGAPTRTFMREDDRLRIHSGVSLAAESAYFASHFDLGLDFLFDATTHRLLKVVLHSNLPGEALFGRYARCSWSLTAASGQTVHSSDQGTKIIDVLSPSSGATTASKGKSSPSPVPREAPLVLDRTADAPDGLAPGCTTDLHGFPSAALEVTQAGDVETLWLF